MRHKTLRLPFINISSLNFQTMFCMTTQTRWGQILLVNVSFDGVVSLSLTSLLFLKKDIRTNATQVFN